MVLRIALFIMMAAGLAGFGAVAWISTRSPSAPEVSASATVAPPEMFAVLAAAHTLRAGALLKPDDLTAVAVAQSAVPKGARVDAPAARADMLGAMLRHTVLAGEVLLPSYVMRAGDRGFLAAVLAPGMRAVTVGVDVVTGTAGLIWPGDHVDLILTETIDDPAVPAGHRIAGETVLHNVRVIAIDQELMQGATAASATTNAPAGGRTVTLEVSPENAERVAVATRLGHLSLSVIAADTPEPPLTPPATPTAGPTAAAGPIAAAAPGQVTWGGDVSSALQSRRKSEPSSGTLRVYEGSADSKEFHF
jgi:pilus assembly protein CpaB